MNKNEPSVIMPKNYSYILAYFASILNKFKKAGVEDIPKLIDSWIDKNIFEIQLYYPKESMINIMDKKSICSRGGCHRESPVNSTFCCNCNMIKLLYKRDDLEELLKKYPKRNSIFHILVDNIFIFSNQYDLIVSEFVTNFKEILKNLYIKNDS